MSDIQKFSKPIFTLAKKCVVSEEKKSTLQQNPLLFARNNADVEIAYSRYCTFDLYNIFSYEYEHTVKVGKTDRLRLFFLSLLPSLLSDRPTIEVRARCAKRFENGSAIFYFTSTRRTK